MFLLSVLYVVPILFPSSRGCRATFCFSASNPRDWWPRCSLARGDLNDVFLPTRMTIPFRRQCVRAPPSSPLASIFFRLVSVVVYPPTACYSEKSAPLHFLPNPVFSVPLSSFSVGPPKDSCPYILHSVFVSTRFRPPLTDLSPFPFVIPLLVACNIIVRLKRGSFISCFHTPRDGKGFMSAAPRLAILLSFCRFSLSGLIQS